MIVVVGAGEMGARHVEALIGAGVDPGDVVIVSRTHARAEALGRKHGTGAAEALPAAETAVVAVSIGALAAVTRDLIDRGYRRILVEKPGALSSAALDALRTHAESAGADVRIAFNRRFYAAVTEARRIADEDGGFVAGAFEFTEVAESVLAHAREKAHSPAVMEHWGLANSLHVIDLFLHLAGVPERWSRTVEGRLDWHPSGARFAGSGVTGRGVSFAYLAAWDGVGRWGVELTTARRRVVLRPMERLRVQELGRFDLTEMPLADDGRGLVAQARAFVENDRDAPLAPLDEAVAHVRIAEEMLGYSP